MPRELDRAARAGVDVSRGGRRHAGLEVAFLERLADSEPVDDEWIGL